MVTGGADRRHGGVGRRSVTTPAAPGGSVTVDGGPDATVGVAASDTAAPRTAVGAAGAQATGDTATAVLVIGDPVGRGRTCCHGSQRIDPLRVTPISHPCRRNGHAVTGFHDQGVPGPDRVNRCRQHRSRAGSPREQHICDLCCTLHRSHPTRPAPVGAASSRPRGRARGAGPDPVNVFRAAELARPSPTPPLSSEPSGGWGNGSPRAFGALQSRFESGSPSPGTADAPS